MIFRFLLLAAVVFWGWTFVATKICLDYVNPFELLGLRLIIAMPVLLLMLVLQKNGLSNFPKPSKRLFLASFFVGAHFLIQFIGIKYTSASNSGWIVSVIPLVIAILARFILNEKIERKTIIGIFLATTGIIVLVSRGNLTELSWLTSTGDWLVLISALTWALFTITTRDISKKYDPLAVTIMVLLPSTIGLFVYIVLAFDFIKYISLPADAIISLAFLGLLGTAFAQWAWQLGISRIGAAKAGIYIYLIPIATTGLAVPYLGESFGMLQAVGGILVLAGVWFAQNRRMGKANS